MIVQTMSIGSENGMFGYKVACLINNVVISAGAAKENIPAFCEQLSLIDMIIGLCLAEIRWRKPVVDLLQ